MATLFQRVQSMIPVVIRAEGGLFVPPQELGAVRHGSGLKALKIRMGTVKSIGKITKTMKMVASQRLRFAQRKMEDSRPYALSASKVITALPPVTEGTQKKNLVFAITSDRGLCGSINSVSVKATKAFVQEAKDKGIECKVASLGDKGTAQFNRFLPANLIFTAHDTAKVPINFTTASIFVDEAFASGEYDQYSVVFSKFVSMLTSTPTVTSFPSISNITERIDKGTLTALDPYEFEEDDKANHLRDLIEFHTANVLFNGFLENQTAELAARMNSMDTASKNASGMLKRLTIAYNRRRQASITTELIEIIAGAEAL